MMSDVDPAHKELNELEDAASSVSTSGYCTGPDAAAVVRSDTLEHLEPPARQKDIFDEDSDDENGIFKSALVESEPPKPSSNGLSVLQDILQDVETEEVGLDADDDNRPFKDAHLQPQLQLTGGVPAIVAPTVEDFGEKGFVSLSCPVNGASRIGSLAQGSSGAAYSLKLDSDEDFIDIKVVEPRKVGDGMSAYVVYKVITRTNASHFKKTDFFVLRRFSDFLGLHQKLCEKYLQNGRIIPPAPDKNVVGTTKMKISKEAENATQDEFLEKRRAALERFLTRTAAHPSLRTDPDFRDFLEVETELPRSSQTSALSSKTVMKLINKVGDSFSSITLKMEETDEWFDEKSRTIEQLEEHLKKLHYSTEALAEFRRNLAVSTGNVSRSLAVLGHCEENSALSGAISQLSEVQKTMERIHNEQATADFYCLSELIKDYIGLVGAVKDAFQERVKAWQAWQNTTANLTKKREAKVKAELQQKSDRIPALRQEIQDLERQQDMAQENFDRISRLIKKEVEMFDIRKAEDFKKCIIQYLECMLKSQEVIASEWERYLPTIKQIRV